MSIAFQHLGDTSLRATCRVKASPERVYAAWTEVDQLKKWFTPREEATLEVSEFDCRVNGKYDVTMVFPDGDRYSVFGRYLELDPPTKIVFTWQWKDAPFTPEETLVSIDLASDAGETVLTLTHDRFMDTDVRDRHHEGWTRCLERLISYELRETR